MDFRSILTSFNMYRNTGENKIDKILEKEDAQLSELLAQDQFVTQFKAGSERVVNYMDYDKYEELVKYITEVGPSDDQKRSFKFPFVSADILSGDVKDYVDFFLPETGTVEVIKKKQTVVPKEVETLVDCSDDDEDDIPALEKTEDEPKQGGKQAEEKAEQKQEKATQKQNKAGETTKADKKQTTQPEMKPQQPSAQIQKQTKEQGQKTDQDKQKIPSLEVEPSLENQDDLEFGDFQSSENKDEAKKPAKKKRQVLKKVIQYETIEDETKQMREPLINKLFSYFKGQVNYTLAGYVCKVLSNLLIKADHRLMKYLLVEEVCHNLLRHIESKSVSEFISQAIVLPPKESQEYHPSSRPLLFNCLIDFLSTNKQNYIMSNASACAIEVFQKIIPQLTKDVKTSAYPLYHQEYFTSKVVSKIMRNTSAADAEVVAIYNAPILSLILSASSCINYQESSGESQQNLIKVDFHNFLTSAINFLTLNEESSPKFGFGRLKILQTITYLIENNIWDSKKQLAKHTNLYQILFALCAYYNNNNVLHNEVLKLISLILEEKNNQEPLLELLFAEDALLKFIIKEAKEDLEIREKRHPKFNRRKGFIGHIIKLARKINEESSLKTNKFVVQMLENPQYEEILHSLVEKEVHQINKNLAGYAIRKNNTNVCFSREDIWTPHRNFLKNCPPAVYNPVNKVDPDIMKQLQSKLDGIEPQKLNEAEAEDMSQTLRYQKWNHHLQYDVEQLMNDL